MSTNAPVLAILDSPNAESKLASLFNVPHVFRLLTIDGIDSYGSTPVSSNGTNIPNELSSWYNAITSIPEVPYQVASSATASNTLVLNRIFLFPDHGALTIKGFLARLIVALVGTGGTSGATVSIDQIDVVFSKISSTGAETALVTTTISPNDSTTTITNYLSYKHEISADFGAGYSLAAGERLAIRIKTYGHTSNSTDGFNHAINVDGGTSSAPTISGNNPTWLCLRLG